MTYYLWTWIVYASFGCMAGLYTSSMAIPFVALATVHYVLAPLISPYYFLYAWNWPFDSYFHHAWHLFAWCLVGFVINMSIFGGHSLFRIRTWLRHMGTKNKKPNWTMDMYIKPILWTLGRMLLLYLALAPLIFLPWTAGFPLGYVISLVLLVLFHVLPWISPWTHEWIAESIVWELPEDERTLIKRREEDKPNMDMKKQKVKEYMAMQAILVGLLHLAYVLIMFLVYDVFGVSFPYWATSAIVGTGAALVCVIIGFIYKSMDNK